MRRKRKKMMSMTARTTGRRPAKISKTSLNNTINSSLKCISCNARGLSKRGTRRRSESFKP